MAETIQSLIDAALRKLGLVGAGEQADATEYADALNCLRMMLDTWSTEDLLMPFTLTEQFDLIPGKAHYQMGVGGDWNTVRPEVIETVRILDGEVTTRLTRSNHAQFAELSTVEKGQPTRYLTSSDGLVAYIEFDREPLTGKVLITSRKPFNVEALDNFDAAYNPVPTPLYPSGMTLTGILTPITFPSGYWSVLVHNLAVWLAPEYPGCTVSPVVAGLADQGRRLIKRRNVQPIFLKTDPVLLRGAR